jgi:uncharacterized cupredoxin-like copper-binding protein
MRKVVDIVQQFECASTGQCTTTPKETEMEKFTPIPMTACVLALATCTTLALAQSDPHQGHDMHGDHANSEQSAGIAGNASKVSRTVEVDMNDAMRFTPNQLSVKRGETIRFVVKNSGKIRHEFNLGTEAALNEHKSAMLMSRDMVHAEPNMVTVEPGKSGEVIWQFTEPGRVSFACLQPGHFGAGMKGSILVAAK